MPYSSLCRIRRSKVEDAQTISDGIDTICREGGAFHTTYFLPSQQWLNVLYKPELFLDHLIAVVEVDGIFAGAGRLFPGEAHTLFRHVGELGMFMLPPFRGKGRGTLLLSWILDWAQTTEIEKITLTVFATNQAAIKLYQRSGFVEEGRYRRHLKIGNQYTDLIRMANYLTPLK